MLVIVTIKTLSLKVVYWEVSVMALHTNNTRQYLESISSNNQVYNRSIIKKSITNRGYGIWQMRRQKARQEEIISGDWWNLIMTDSWSSVADLAKFSETHAVSWGDLQVYHVMYLHIIVVLFWLLVLIKDTQLWVHCTIILIETFPLYTS